MSMKKPIILGGLGVVIVVVVVVNLVTTYEAATGVEVTPAKRGEIIERVSGPGVVYAESSVKISSSVMGRIVDLPIEEGDAVKPGQVLLRIDPSQYEASLSRAEAAHHAALARLDLAEARLEDARLEFDRGNTLRERDLVSERDLDAARTALAVARAEVDAARENAREAEAARRAAADDLDKTVITSPISGTVTSLNVEEGEIAITGTMNNPGTVLMTISNLGSMEVRAEIDETDVARVRLGQPVDISVDAFPDTLLNGTVSLIGSSSSLARGSGLSPDERSTFDVKVRVEDALPGLRPGMTTTVDIVTGREDSTLYVPLRALVLREIGKGEAAKEYEGVFVVKNDRAEFVPITTGISDDSNIEALDAIDEGSPVITGPFKTLRDLRDSTRVKISRERDDVS
jgi:HlyD family secretion protein